MQTVLSIDLITTDAEIRGGRPCIAGTGLRVTDIAMAHLYHQRTADQIAADYELTLAQAHAALAYYYQHKAQLDADIRNQVLAARRFKEKTVAAALRFYLDENVPVAVARQLQARDIEAITVRDLDMLGAADALHITKAAADGYVFCTYDSDYLQMAAEGVEHSGIVFGQQDSHYIGDWVKFLSLLHAVFTPDEMRRRIEFL